LPCQREGGTRNVNFTHPDEAALVAGVGPRSGSSLERPEKHDW
jgi:hypothetical protein